MSHSSASTDHITSESRRRDQWASVRLFGGIAGLLLVLGGVIFLTVLATVDMEITSRVASGIGSCVVAIVGGGLLARSCFGSQRAADRTAAFMARLDVDDDRLDELHGELAELRNTLHAALLGFAEDRAAREQFAAVLERFLAHEEVVGGQSEKARGDVAAILDLLAKQDLEAADGRKTLSRLTASLEGVHALLSDMQQRYEQAMEQMAAVVRESAERYAALVERLEEAEAEIATLRHAQRAAAEESAAVANGKVSKLPLARPE